MNLNRRGFLELFGLGAAGLVLDPERLLWVPGQKTIFLPSVELIEAREFVNTLITPAWVTKEVARLWINTIRISPPIFPERRLH